MVKLLEELSGGCEYKVHSTTSFSWQRYLNQQFNTIPMSKKLAMLAKYLNDFGLIEESFQIWKEGLELPEEHITEEDRLRFQMNLGIISQKSAYDSALLMNYDYIAEIALENLLHDSVLNRDCHNAEYYLKKYLQSCKGTSHDYFKESKYYFYLYDYKLNALNKSALQLTTDFAKAYHALLKDGEILYATNLMIKHYGSIAAQNQGNLQILNDSIVKINQVVPYGDYSSLANAYYYIANLAISVDKKDIAVKYHEKCLHMMELCCANGVYQGDQYHELWSCIYHQGAMIAPNGRISIQKERLALSEAEKIQDKMKKYCHKGFIYSGLCSIYMRNNYELALKYGQKALKYGKQSGSLQNIARTFTYLAIADAKHGMRQNAIQKFKKSYAIHIQIYEGLDYFYSALEECKIDISEINNE